MPSAAAPAANTTTTTTATTTTSAAPAAPTQRAFAAPARGALRPCCIQCVRAFKYDAAAVCTRRNRWKTCERCQAVKKRCEEVSRSPFAIISC